MTGIDLDQLEAAAKAATPGPWKNVDTPAMYIRDEIRVADGTRIAMALTTRHPREGEQFIDFDQAEANAAFIAAANPATVLEVIATIRKRDKAMRRLARALRIKTRALAIAQRECKHAQERAAKQEG